jgi:hypothetical protein
MAIKSVQSQPKRSHKSSTARLQAESLKSAFRNGMAWDDDEVARLAAGIARDETTFELAKALSRSYYGTMGARSSVGFAMRHWNAIQIGMNSER